MSEKRTESCGRCAMSTVVDAVGESGEAGDAGGDADGELRATSPAAWFSNVVSRLDAAASRFVYGPR
jgi:hypothetical protein